ncbi:hypothetical protein NP493_437g04011 [Ridgeia piscesae]|uniref:Phospholipase B1, membrane-associated n=1 Tax=Ridgeia piscesae TaxID=27915 RepID=A0AAD9NTY3_RIDPI|nr:hypothetical protein NP493_437g04011 [Ridgeia piscesae]
MEGTRAYVLLTVAVFLQVASGVNDYDGQWRSVVRTANASHRLGDRWTRNVQFAGSPDEAGYGLGAESVVEVLVKNRGESWSIGGDKSLDEGILTLTNLMRKYNPDVKGFSVGAKWISEEDAGFNVAFGGHESRDMPADAHELIQRLQQSNDEGKIDFQKDWKMTTLLIGGNDMCDYCKDRQLRSAEKYAENIKQALDLLQKHVPRMLVQVVVMKMCECALLSETRRELRPLQVQYYEALKQLIEESGRYDQKDDFTVVLQPFMRDWRPPMNANGRIDRTYFSVDCFHPGRKMHRSMAYMLWNNMCTNCVPAMFRSLQQWGTLLPIGGDKSLDEGILTLTNIIRKFNPKVKGFSTGATLVAEEDAWLNVAVGGYKASDMPGDAIKLIHRLERSNDDGKIDYKNDWKLTTLFVGGNDLCDYCKEKQVRSPEMYAENIKQALDLLQKHVPRMLVQVVVMFDVTPVRFLQHGIFCSILQTKMCECALDHNTRPELRPVQLQYYEALKELIEDSGRYDQKEDFTVVLQPFMRDMALPLDSAPYIYTNKNSKQT